MLPSCRDARWRSKTLFEQDNACSSEHSTVSSTSYFKGRSTDIQASIVRVFGGHRSREGVVGGAQSLFGPRGLSTDSSTDILLRCFFAVALRTRPSSTVLSRPLHPRHASCLLQSQRSWWALESIRLASQRVTKQRKAIRRCFLQS